LKKVLITGGAGFIGRNFIHSLSKDERDYEITVIDNESLGKEQDIDHEIKNFINSDLSGKEYYDLVDKDYDYIIHLAAFTRVVDSISNPDLLFSNNVMASYNLMDLCRRRNIKNLIIASTGGAIVGETGSLISEDSFPQPISPYGASKLAVESMGHSYNECYGMNISCLRFSNVYGPRSNRKESVVARFLKTILSGKNLNIYGDGNQERDYIFVEDVVRGINMVMAQKKKGVFQLSTGATTSVNKLIKIIQEVVGSKYDIKVNYLDSIKGEIYKTSFNNSKARREIGFKTEIDLYEGIEKTWNWLKQN